MHTTTKAFIEGFPKGIVALVRQKNGKPRIIVSRPPNRSDALLASAEKSLCSLIEDESNDLIKINDEDEEEDEEHLE